MYTDNPYLNPFGQYPNYQQSPQKQSNKIFVNGKVGAEAYLAPFNSEIILIDANGNTIYNVDTDSQGRKTIKIFDVIEHKEAPQISANDILARLETVEKALNINNVEEVK